MNLRSIFSENLPVKIVSLLVACFLWFYVTSQEVQQQKILVPIQLVNLPDSLTFLDNIPEQAEINVRASRKDLLLLRLFQKLSMNVDLTQATEGRLTVALSTRNLSLPRNIPPQNVSIQTPTGITFHFDKLLTKTLPVKVKEQGQLAEGFVKLRDPRVIPANVQITGPSHSMNYLEFVSTEPLDLSKKKSTFKKELRLLLDQEMFQTDPEKVEVSYYVEPIVRKTLANIVPVFIRDTEDLVVDFRPPTGSITVQGPKSTLDTLVSRDVDMTVVLGDLKVGKYRLPAQFFVPGGVRIEEASPDSFQVTLREPES